MCETRALSSLAHRLPPPLILTYYSHFHRVNSRSILEYSFLYLEFASNSWSRKHRFVLRRLTRISMKKVRWTMSMATSGPTSISSFFFNSCANSARVSRKVAVLGVVVEVVVVDAAVAVGVATGFSFVAVELAGDVAEVLESFIFLTVSFSARKKHARALSVIISEVGWRTILFLLEILFYFPPCPFVMFCEIQ